MIITMYFFYFHNKQYIFVIKKNVTFFSQHLDGKKLCYTRNIFRKCYSMCDNAIFETFNKYNKYLYFINHNNYRRHDVDCAIFLDKNSP